MWVVIWCRVVAATNSSSRDIAELAFQGAKEARAAADHLILVVQDGRVGFHRLFGIEHRRQDLVLDLQRAAASLGGGLALGDDRDDALADESGDIVEHV